MGQQNGFDYDYVVIGSGFGGSVSALRLAEKGYKVGVLEKGKRWQKEDFPKQKSPACDRRTVVMRYLQGNRRVSCTLKRSCVSVVLCLAAGCWGRSSF
jgi:choline dehydrogenase-like flavoprotein